MTNTINNKYEFKVHCKKAITNIHLKPTSCIDPNTIKSVFKSFLHTAHSICLEKYIKEEYNLVVEYNNKKSHKNIHENNVINRDYINLKKLPYILNISPKIKREFKKIGKDIAFTSGKS